MKSINENEEKLIKHSNLEKGENDKFNRERVEQIASDYNHQEKINHIENSVVRYNATIERVKASRSAEK